jgi:hypothetical protein
VPRRYDPNDPLNPAAGMVFGCVAAFIFAAFVLAAGTAFVWACA